MARRKSTKSTTTDSEHSLPPIKLASQEDDTYYEAIEILAENGKGMYLVKWAGTDPKTGRPWEPSWSAKRDCTSQLLSTWKEKKAKQQLSKSSRSTKTSSTGKKRKLSTTPQQLSPEDSQDAQPTKKRRKSMKLPVREELRVELREEEEESEESSRPISRKGKGKEVNIQAPVISTEFRHTVMKFGPPKPRKVKSLPTPQDTSKQASSSKQQESISAQIEDEDSHRTIPETQPQTAPTVLPRNVPPRADSLLPPSLPRTPLQDDTITPQKPLRPVPIVSPAVFRNILKQKRTVSRSSSELDEQPGSPIESFSSPLKHPSELNGDHINNEIQGDSIETHTSKSQTQGNGVNGQLPQVSTIDPTSSMHERIDDNDLMAHVEEMEEAYVNYDVHEDNEIEGTQSHHNSLQSYPPTASTQKADIDSQSQILTAGLDFTQTQDNEVRDELPSSNQDVPHDQLHVLDSQATRLTLIADTLEVQIQAKSRYKDLEANHSSLKSAYSKLESETDHLEKAVDVAREDARRYITQFEEKCKELVQTSKTLQRTQIKVTALEVVIEELERSLEKVKENGLAQFKKIYDARVKKLEDEVFQWQGLYDIMRKKDERTGDEVRKQAAEGSEWKNKYEDIINNFDGILEESEERHRKRVEMLEADKLGLEVKLEDEIESRNSLEEENILLRKELAKLKEEVSQLKTSRRRTLQTQAWNGYHSERSDGEEDNDTVSHVCQYVGNGEPCYERFPSTEAVIQHAYELHYALC
ncbi:hypothetical protein ABKN59_000760 [Abortiporus biennis]